MAKIADDGSGKRSQTIKASGIKTWNDREEARKPGQNERYDPINDVYVLERTKRYRVKTEISGITPEMTSEFLEKIKKKFAEQDYVLAPKKTPIAIRFSIRFPYNAENKKKFREIGYKFPSGVDLRIWSDFIYDGLQGVLYENRSQIVCSGEECRFSEIPGLFIDSFFLWAKADLNNIKKRAQDSL